ncbi:carboxypeptidase B-like [Mytilus galloprovincialis]|uniref:carboxypeptidase B-like n=1 Tax=Mytilus galloprovincialis TaxID=29158 RepID=UPI003F7CBA03
MIKIIRIVLLFFLVTNVTTKRVDYTNFEVLRIGANARNPELKSIMANYRSITLRESPEDITELAIPPEELIVTKKKLKKAGIDYTMLTRNLQKSIDTEKAAVSANVFQFNRYNTYDKIEEYLNSLDGCGPIACSQTITIGETDEKRPIYMVKIWKNGMQLSNRSTILVDGGIHAREWISPAVVLNFINFLKTNTAAVNLVDEFQWFVIPVLNPDGYVYTHTTDRLWRKNRKQSQVNSNCFGTDLNRNFGYQWDPLESASNDPCNLVYRGPTPFSEKESIALRDAMLQQGQTYTSYISFHSYGQYYLYPWLHSDQLTADWRDLDDCAKAATAAIFDYKRKRYEAGAGGSLLYQASGTSADYAKAIANIKYAYTIELRDKGRKGFVLSYRQIIPTWEENRDGIIALVDCLVQKNNLIK